MRRIITRADDYASSRSANAAIAGLLRPDSLKRVHHGARSLSCRGRAAVGASQGHLFRLPYDAERGWDNVRWGPVAAKEQVPSLVDEAGYFYQDPFLFQDHPPCCRRSSWNAKPSDKLTAAGFSISYADSHICRSASYGLQEELDRWIEAKG